MLSSNGNGRGNIYIPTAACLVAMAMVVVISTYLCLAACLPACLPAYAVALAIKQAVIGRFHFEAFRIFTNRGGGEKSADMIRPSWEATVVDLWPSLCHHGMS